MSGAALANLGVDDDGRAIVEAEPGPLARAFADLVDDPPWPWLERARGLVPWAAGAAALDDVRARVDRAFAVAEGVARRVSDRAFAARVAERRRIDPGFGELVRVLDVDELSTGAVEAVVARWPRFARRVFRVVARFGEDDRAVVGTDGTFRYRNHDGLMPFRLRGGGLVEPWPQPLVELTSCWFVDEHGEPHALGLLASSHDGAVLETRRGPLCFDTGGELDEAAVDKARIVVEAAAAAGWRGACAVDGFLWRGDDGEVRLRGAAALRARFTAGHVALGLALRERPAPGTRLRFRVAEARFEERP